MAKLGIEELLPRVKEIEELLRFPAVAGHVAKATELATTIAQNAPDSAIAELAAKVIREANALGGAGAAGADRSRLNKALWHLRFRLQEAKRPQ